MAMLNNQRVFIILYNLYSSLDFSHPRSRGLQAVGHFGTQKTSIPFCQRHVLGQVSIIHWCLTDVCQVANPGLPSGNLT
jgi:hypothetical protein